MVPAGQVQVKRCSCYFDFQEKAKHWCQTEGIDLQQSQLTDCEQYRAAWLASRTSTTAGASSTSVGGWSVRGVLNSQSSSIRLSTTSTTSTTSATSATVVAPSIQASFMPPSGVSSTDTPSVNSASSTSKVVLSANSYSSTSSANVAGGTGLAQISGNQAGLTSVTTTTTATTAAASMTPLGWIMTSILAIVLVVVLAVLITFCVYWLQYRVNRKKKTRAVAMADQQVPMQIHEQPLPPVMQEPFPPPAGTFAATQAQYQQLPVGEGSFQPFPVPEGAMPMPGMMPMPGTQAPGMYPNPYASFQGY